MKMWTHCYSSSKQKRTKLMIENNEQKQDMTRDEEQNKEMGTG